MGRRAKRTGPKSAVITIKKLKGGTSVKQSSRPKTRGECKGVSRPCPYISCKYNTYLEITDAGNIKILRPHLKVDEVAESCVLDVADRGPQILDEIGDILNITRERARQIEGQALSHMFVKRTLLV